MISTWPSAEGLRAVRQTRGCQSLRIPRDGRLSHDDRGRIGTVFRPVGRESAVVLFHAQNDVGRFRRSGALVRPGDSRHRSGQAADRFPVCRSASPCVLHGEPDDEWPALFSSRGADRKSQFASTRELPFSDPWPMYCVAEKRLRAYSGEKGGLFISARASESAPFGKETLILDATATGPIEGPIWVSPQEDVIFYCSPGPGKAPGSGRRLWMVRI